MKKIFLTSGIILCMACPAFADTQTITDGTGKCVIGVLGTAENGATVNFVAQWAPIYKTVTLNLNTAANGGTGADFADIYTVPEQSSIWTTINTTTNVLEDEIAENGTVIAAADIPNGKSVTFTLDNNIASGSGVSQNGSVDPANRVFKGFYAAQTGGVALIDANGALTGTGATAAYDNTADTTWYAQYNCATPTITNPVRPGYEFVKWTTDPAGETDYTPCINESGTTLYAQWNVLPTTITFDCTNNATHSGTEVITGTQLPTGSKTIAMDASGTLEKTCTLEGWTFNGWTCTSGAFTSDAAGETPVTGVIAANTTVYMKTATAVSCTANWTANVIGTTWDTDGGSAVSGGENQCTYDGNITIPSSAPEKLGFEFLGWKVESTGI